MRALKVLLPLFVVSFLACGDEPRRNNDDDDDGSGAAGATAAGGNGSGGNTTVASGGAGPGTGGGSGMACLNASECGPAGTAICNPKTQMCGPVQCDAEAQNCPGDDLCLGQVEGLPQFGACYTSCVPNANGCGAGESCLDVSGGIEESGVCFGSGTAAKGAMCEQTDVTTGCQGDMRCLIDANEDGSCFDTCDYWGGTGNCPAVNEFCENRGFCLTEQQLGLGPFDPAPVGSPCAVTDPTFCGVVGDKLNGLCIDAGNGMECLKICRTAGTECTPMESCVDIGLGAGQGVCAPV